MLDYCDDVKGKGELWFRELLDCLIECNDGVRRIATDHEHKPK